MNVDALVDHGLLTAGAERRLFRKAAGTSGPAAARAREEIVRHNLRLVAKQARTFYVPDGAAHDHDDLFQAGVEGLMRAVDDFDPDRGFRFSTYAVPWVRQAIGRYVANHVSAIRLPVGVRDDFERARRRRAALVAGGAEPTRGEVAEAAGISERRLGDVEGYHAVSAPRSLHEPAGGLARAGGDGPTVEALVPDGSEGPEERAVRAVEASGPRGLPAALATLPPDLADVVRLRFGLGSGEEPLSYKVAGRRLGLSHEAVRKREERALSLLRAALSRAADPAAGAPRAGTEAA